jgi:hypothetical protein
MRCPVPLTIEELRLIAFEFSTNVAMIRKDLSQLRRMDEIDYEVFPPGHPGGIC